MDIYEKKYKESMAKMSTFLAKHDGFTISKDGEMYKELSEIFPELLESDDERIRKAIYDILLIDSDEIREILDANNVLMQDIDAWLEKLGGKESKTPDENIINCIGMCLTDADEQRFKDYDTNLKECLSWLKKQGSKPNWCHHEVDLPNCSEEYRKAYYDGWNNCNMQHSQCKSDGNDVVKCLINGMKFYYEGNEEATWGTEKFSMKVKDILSWLEKQGKQKDFYTKQQLRDMGFAFSLNGDIVPLDTINEAIKEYLANEKKKWENDQKPVEWIEEDEQFLLVCKNALTKYQVSDKWDASIISRWLENRLKPLRPQSPTKTH